MSSLFIFGLGYTAQRLAKLLRQDGWQVSGTGKSGDISFEDEGAIARAVASATHILSSVPPVDDGDPVLDRYGDLLRSAPARWTGYLSSTGVYGDTGGAWVDETAPIGRGRRNARAQADLRWQDLSNHSHVFRLPGIYGPGRSALDRVKAGQGHRINVPDQVFSRIHVDDIARCIIASFDGPDGVYNLADDLPAPQADVMAFAATLLGLEPAPLQSLEEANLSPAARAFYSENRRVANGKAKRLLGWNPRYPDYRSGLRAC